MAAPNQPGPVTDVMGAWFEIEPQRAPGPMGLLESADRSRVTVVVASQAWRNGRVRSGDQWIKVLLGTNRNDRGRQFASIAEDMPIRTENPIRSKERSPTKLRCASFPARLSVTWGAVKGQDERPLFGAALDSSHITTGGIRRWKAINKEGRHVGLDFYDLLIEGLNTQISTAFDWLRIPTFG